MSLEENDACLRFGTLRSFQGCPRCQNGGRRHSLPKGADRLLVAVNGYEARSDRRADPKMKSSPHFQLETACLHILNWYPRVD